MVFPCMAYSKNVCHVWILITFWEQCTCTSTVHWSILHQLFVIGTQVKGITSVYFLIRLKTFGCVSAACLYLTSRQVIRVWTVSIIQHIECPSTQVVLLYPLRRWLWSDVPQMLFNEGMDPTSLLRRSEGEVTAMQCNFHRLQLIVFTNN